MEPTEEWEHKTLVRKLKIEWKLPLKIGWKTIRSMDSQPILQQ